MDRSTAVVTAGLGIAFGFILYGCYGPKNKSISNSEASINVFSDVSISTPFVSKNGKYVCFWGNGAHLWDEPNGMRKISLPSNVLVQYLGNDGSVYGVSASENKIQSFRVAVGKKIETPWPGLSGARSLVVTDESPDGVILGFLDGGDNEFGPARFVKDKVIPLETVLPRKNWTPDVHFEPSSGEVVGKFIENQTIFSVRWKNGKLLGEPTIDTPSPSISYARSPDGKTNIVERKDGVYSETGAVSIRMTGPDKLTIRESDVSDANKNPSWKLMSVIFAEDGGELVIGNAFFGSVLNTVVWTKKDGWKTIDAFVESCGGNLGDWKFSGQKFTQMARCSEDGRTIALLAMNGERTAPAIIRFHDRTSGP